jgi:acyl-coenzyme A synthetase/AMP-(fatty) acid ligase
VMSHREYFFAMAGMHELMDLTGRHRFLCTLPFYYSGGRNSCIAHLLRGDCVVLYPNTFGAEEYFEVVARERITVGAVVPSAVRHFFAAAHSERPVLPGLSALFCTGAPLHAEEKQHAMQCLTPHFHERYGTAETMAVSILRPAELPTHADSVGQPHSLITLEIVDAEERPLPTMAAGRLRMRGPGVGRPLPGHELPGNFRGGWYYPGEIAHLDRDGYIYLHGRTTDVIMRHGAKVYPAEVEAVLIAHAAVAEAAVLGQPDADREESIVAFVVARGELSTGELLAHCRASLSAHKVPRQFHFLAEMPRNTAGKIDKRALALTLGGQ